MRSNADLYACAAFLAGEGTFIYSPKPGQLAVRAAQTEKVPLVWLHGILGGHINGPYKQAKSNQRPYWYWAETDAPAAGIMLTLFSFMRSISLWKCEQIKTALAAWRAKPCSTRAMRRVYEHALAL